ncbi:major antigen-like [Papaver somniferum]|uniref:major antigen-like n=1 Tax=Papaver somniferum TaxID=3469 RepID=UPI000E6FEAFE|nr:major antigen-like [Papaver somniferum]
MDIYLETIMDECEKIEKDEEIELWKRKYSDLETQFVVQKQDLVELKDYKTKYDGLCEEIQENKIVIEEGKKRVSKAENELDKYKTLYDKLNICIQDCKRRFTENGIYELDLERKLQDYETQFTVEITKLVNELNGYKSRWRAQLGRHIKILGEEVKETTIDQREECNRLYSVIESLERDIRVAEDEINDLQTEYRGLKSRSASWKKELDLYRAMCGGSLVELIKDKKMQSVGYEKELEVYKTSNNRPREEIMVLAEARKIMSKGKKIAEENLACSKGDVIGSYPVFRKLERGKRVAEDETEDLKTEFRELKKELEGYKAKCDRLSAKLEKKKMQRVRYKSKLKNVTLVRDALEKELEGYKTSNDGRKEDIMGLTEARKLICEAEKGAEEKLTCFEVMVPYQMEGDKQEVPMQDLRLKPNSTGDGSDKEISRNLNILTANTTKRCSDNHKYMPPLKRSFSREESGISSGGNFIGSSSAPKRLRVSENFTGISENVEDDNHQSGGNRMLNVNKRKEDVGMKSASISSGGASGSSRPISAGFDICDRSGEDSVVSSITVPARLDQQKSIVVYRAIPVWGRYSSLVNEAEDGDASSDSVDKEIEVELEPSKVLQIAGRTELENSVVKYVDGSSKILNEPVVFSSWAKVVADIVANGEQVS